MPCGVCKSNDLNDTLLTVNAKCSTWFVHYTILSMWYMTSGVVHMTTVILYTLMDQRLRMLSDVLP